MDIMKKIYKARQTKYKKFMALESKLLKLISETNNQELFNTFIEWQETRTVLNGEFIEILTKKEL